LAEVQRFKNNVLPGSDKAVLELANGKKIILDSTANGTIALEGSTKIIKENNGQLLYQSEADETEVAFNKVSTPKGGQYHLVLLIEAMFGSTQLLPYIFLLHLLVRNVKLN